MSYALLIKIKIFPSMTNMIIAVVIGFYFLSASIFYQENIMQILAYSVLILFVAFVIALIYFGMKKEKK